MGKADEVTGVRLGEVTGGTVRCAVPTRVKADYVVGLCESMRYPIPTLGRVGDAVCQQQTWSSSAASTASGLSQPDTVHVDEPGLRHSRESVVGVVAHTRTLLTTAMGGFAAGHGRKYQTGSHYRPLRDTSDADRSQITATVGRCSGVGPVERDAS